MTSPEHSKYQLSSQLVASEVSEETVILDYEAGKYFSLDGVGSFVWSILQKDGPVSASDICKRITEEYEIDEEKCMTDLEALLATLKSNGLITTT